MASNRAWRAHINQMSGAPHHPDAIAHTWTPDQESMFALAGQHSSDTGHVVNGLQEGPWTCRDCEWTIDDREAQSDD